MLFRSERRKARVGLVWSGGFRPNQPELWSLNRRRNIPLAKLAPLRHPGIEFYSLQKGEPAAEIAASGLEGRIIDLAPSLKDFADTAAAMSSLDLVISVDTSVAHLAGALAKPVWTLVCFRADWRWLRDREDTPWYPTMRLYRQPAAGDWGAVVQAVARDLSPYAVQHVRSLADQSSSVATAKARFAEA